MLVKFDKEFKLNLLGNTKRSAGIAFSVTKIVATQPNTIVLEVNELLHYKFSNKIQVISGINKI